LVGVAGFAVDASGLWVALHLLGLGLYSGRVLSFTLGATSTWWLNRRFTYRDRTTTLPLYRQWAGYMGASAVGALANYSSYALIVATVPVAAEYPILGVAAGSGAGMLINYVSYTRLVFRSKTPPAEVGLPSAQRRP